MESTIDKQIKGSLASHVVREFFTNSAHYPIANILLEMMVTGIGAYVMEPDLYAILFAAMAQASFLGLWQYRERPRPFIGNLIGPLLYTLAEIAIDGSGFSLISNHIGYWGFSLVIGGFQQARVSLAGMASVWFVLLENLARTYILFAAYWMFEARIEPDYRSVGDFFGNASHLFMFMTLSLIGLAIGFSNVNAERYLVMLRRMAGELQTYSEWLLGKRLLEQAVSNSTAMSLQRHDRAILFADIRGFTQWSETTEPEKVVAMLNRYFEAAEDAWKPFPVIKAKLTGDEIMLVLDEPGNAVKVAQALWRSSETVLAEYGLAVGTGIHCGPLVEGLMGSHNVKGYDVIGDTVNTAKRICDIAGGGEILVSRSVLERLDGKVATGEMRSVKLKGKQGELDVFPLIHTPND